MAGQIYDPAKVPGSPDYTSYRLGLEAVPPAAPGPGGATINVENNEKGVLETELYQVMQNKRGAELRSNHDGQRQGIYRTNSMGDKD